MYKILVVDDNPYDRKGIKSILDNGNLQLEVLATCSNGAEVVERLEELKPDIILSDISMPIMNGIEMTKVLKEKEVDVKIIFMSCYYEFEYVKSAIDLDIYGYVLKPVVPKDLIGAVSKVIDELEAENSARKEKKEILEQLNNSLPSLQDEFLRELLFGSFSQYEEICKRSRFLKMDFPENHSIYILSVEINDYERFTSCIDIDDRYLAMYSIKNLLTSFNSSFMNIYPIQVSSKEFAAVIFCNIPTQDENHTVLLDTVLLMKDEISRKLNLSITIGISKASKNITDIPILYQQSLNAIKTRFYSNITKIIFFDEIEEMQNMNFEEMVNLQDMYKEVKEIAISDNEKDITAFLDKYLSARTILQGEHYVKSFTYSLVNIFQIVLIEMEISIDDIFDQKQLIWQKLNNFETIIDVKMWLYNIIKMSIEHINKIQKSGYGQIVENIKNVIKNNYMKHLTINDIAKAINFSPGHANNIFKIETDRTIFDYLTEFRMEKAKELLKDPYSRIYMVMEEVGYTNKSYFCLAFKRHTGLTPMEYKNNTGI